MLYHPLSMPKRNIKLNSKLNALLFYTNATLTHFATSKNGSMSGVGGLEQLFRSWKNNVMTRKRGWTALSTALSAFPAPTNRMKTCKRLYKGEAYASCGFVASTTMRTPYERIYR